MAMHVPYPGLPDRPPQPSPDRPHRRFPGYREHIVPQPPELDPYSRLYRDRIVFLHGALDDDAANDLVAKLLDLDSDNADLELTLQLNSADGSFGAMLAVYDTMEHIAAPVRTVCIGQAEGPAAVLLASGAPGRRFLLPAAHVVLRQPVVRQPDAPGGDAQIELDKATWTRDKVEEILAERTGRDRERIRHDTDRPTLLSAEEAVAYGIADGILPHRRASAPNPD
jgi:ATP-dependent Clp protease protease subunit